MIGTTVGKYRIVDKLGRGGMGTVYKAVDQTLDREVAIKVLNPDLTDSDVLKRFRAEAVTLARLNHPGIATIYELHHQGEDLLMVIEYVRGETFHDLSDRLGPLAPPQAAHLCMQVLEALGHAHRGGVVHRDLKPANLMITESGAVKVMDFGIARVLGSEHFTHGGYMMGTPAYMAPEQVLGREIDGRADLYSVGVVLYRLLTGHLPFKADTAISMVQMQISEPPTPIVTFKPDLPAWCAVVADRALSKSPADRFQSAEEFRAALLSAVTPQALGEMPTLATPAPPGFPLDADRTMPHRTPTAVAQSGPGAVSPSGGMPTVRPAMPSLPTPTGTPPAERTGTTVVLGRTHLAAIAALLVVVAVGIAILAFAALGGRSGAPASQPAEQQAATDAGSPQGAATDIPADPSAPPIPPAPAGSPPPAAAAEGKPVAQVPETSAPSSGVATAGAGLAGAKPAGGRGATVSTPPPAVPPTAVPPGPGRGTTSGSAAEVVPASSSAPPPAASAASALPLATFNEVRVLVADGDKSREREGVLQIGGGQVAVVAPGGGAPIVALQTSSVNGLFYARSKQPRWRDANGKEIESRTDLGRLGFLRGERNWIILLTAGEPVILRIEDSALRTVLPALEERTGLKIQR
jgi:serine/threonine-protein kinase